MRNGNKVAIIRRIIPEGTSTQKTMMRTIVGTKTDRKTCGKYWPNGGVERLDPLNGCTDQLSAAFSLDIGRPQGK
jgi:hypothetical protein